jgi:hypothetical protein
MVEHEVILKIF